MQTMTMNFTLESDSTPFVSLSEIPKVTTFSAGVLPFYWWPMFLDWRQAAGSSTLSNAFHFSFSPLLICWLFLKRSSPWLTTRYQNKSLKLSQRWLSGARLFYIKLRSTGARQHFDFVTPDSNPGPVGCLCSYSDGLAAEGLSLAQHWIWS